MKERNVMKRNIFKIAGSGTATGLLIALALIVAMLTTPVAAWADRDKGHPGGGPHGGREFGPSQPYPPRGAYVDTVPHGHHVYVHRGDRFFFYEGIWYRPFGPRFVVIAPPIGIIVPFLPPFYGTIWLGGIPYYYANDVYYKSVPEGYMVVEPPKENTEQTNTLAEKIFIYPRNHQSEQQQAKDRYECHRWAVGQTNYDPTQSTAEKGPDKMKRSDYQRAMNACLDGRGYTVK